MRLLKIKKLFQNVTHSFHLTLIIIIIIINFNSKLNFLDSLASIQFNSIQRASGIRERNAPLSQSFSGELMDETVAQSGHSSAPSRVDADLVIADVVTTLLPANSCSFYS